MVALVIPVMLVASHFTPANSLFTLYLHNRISAYNEKLIFGRVVLIGPPPKSYAVHPLDLLRSTLSLIGPGHPLSLKASTIFPTQGGVYLCHIV